MEIDLFDFTSFCLDFFKYSGPLCLCSQHNNYFSLYRYAALNLAAMHARFGHQEAALNVLNEAIMMAQEGIRKKMP